MEVWVICVGVISVDRHQRQPKAHGQCQCHTLNNDDNDEDEMMVMVGVKD